MFLKSQYTAWFAALALSTSLIACGDDQAEPGGEAGAPDSSGGGTNKPDDKDPDGKDPDGKDPEPGESALPAGFAIKGCEAELAPLCSVAVDKDGKITATCGSKILTGAVVESGPLTLAAADQSVECQLEPKRDGSWTAQCTAATETKTCSLTPDSAFVPGLSCIQIPGSMDNLQVSAGAGEPLELGSCQLLQNGCNFQATCAGGAALAGTVTQTGLSFQQVLPALAASGAEVEPSFKAGEAVQHNCSATFDSSKLEGKCEAGGKAAGRGGNPPAVPHTSVYTISAKPQDLPGTCEPLAPLPEGQTSLEDGELNEYLFVLGSCDLNKPYIGEPVCLYRQNNCAWEVQCGKDLVFGGKLKEGEKTAHFKLTTGTPCEGGFKDGKFEGKCTVPGQVACELYEETPVPGKDGQCDALYDKSSQTPSPIVPDEPNVDPKTPGVGFLSYASHGCGNASVQCRLGMQHGCNFTSVCKLGNRFATMITHGTVSKKDGRGVMNFNGADGFECKAYEVLENEVGQRPTYSHEGVQHNAATLRASGEWTGNCAGDRGTGPMLCTDGLMSGNGKEILGLRVFFGEQACGLQHFTGALTTEACDASALESATVETQRPGGGVSLADFPQFK